MMGVDPDAVFPATSTTIGSSSPPAAAAVVPEIFPRRSSPFITSSTSTIPPVVPTIKPEAVAGVSTAGAASIRRSSSAAARLAAALAVRAVLVGRVVGLVRWWRIIPPRYVHPSARLFAVVSSSLRSFFLPVEEDGCWCVVGCSEVFILWFDGSGSSPLLQLLPASSPGGRGFLFSSFCSRCSCGLLRFRLPRLTYTDKAIIINSFSKYYSSEFIVSPYLFHSLSNLFTDHPVTSSNSTHVNRC